MCLERNWQNSFQLTHILKVFYVSHGCWLRRCLLLLNHVSFFACSLIFFIYKDFQMDNSAAIIIKFKGVAQKVSLGDALSWIPSLFIHAGHASADGHLYNFFRLSQFSNYHQGNFRVWINWLIKWTFTVWAGPYAFHFRLSNTNKAALYLQFQIQTAAESATENDPISWSPIF